MKSAEDIARMQKLYQDGWSKRKIAVHLRVSRNTLDRYLGRMARATPAFKHKQISGRDRFAGKQSHVVQPSLAWHIGPYHYTSAGELSLAGSRIELAPAQMQLLFLFTRKPNQLVSHQEIAQQLWPGQPPGVHWKRRVSLAVHRLRQAFAIGPLGDTIIRSVYQKGYVLIAQVKEAPPLCLRNHPLEDRASAGQLHNPFYSEVHNYWPNRDPYILPRQERLLQKSVLHDPCFQQGYLELCYFQLLQCFWGMRSSEDVLPTLRTLLDTVDAFTLAPPGWLGIKAEVQSLLLWQPHTTQRLYGTWLADTLPRGMPLFAWARHLIFTGEAQTALSLIQARLHTDLCQGWLVLAMAHLANGDFKSAESATQTQLNLDSSMVGTRLFLALLLARRGQSAQATHHVLQTGILDCPFRGVQALVAYSLAHGPLQHRAHQLLNEALKRVRQNSSHEGALAYWGLAALALGRPTDAIHLLKLSVQKRCYSAPVLRSTPLIQPYSHTPAYRLFREKMQQSFPILC